MAKLFQVIEETQIRQTRDNSTTGILVDWIEKIAGMETAVNVQGWSELCYIGECYKGDGFKVVCLE